MPHPLGDVAPLGRSLSTRSTWCTAPPFLWSAAPGPGPGLGSRVGLSKHPVFFPPGCFPPLLLRGFSFVKFEPFVNELCCASKKNLMRFPPWFILLQTKKSRQGRGGKHPDVCGRAAQLFFGIRHSNRLLLPPYCSALFLTRRSCASSLAHSPRSEFGT